MCVLFLYYLTHLVRRNLTSSHDGGASRNVVTTQGHVHLQYKVKVRSVGWDDFKNNAGLFWGSDQQKISIYDDRNIV